MHGYGYNNFLKNSSTLQGAAFFYTSAHILQQMYLWTRKSPLNFRSYPDADFGYRPNRSASALVPTETRIIVISLHLSPPLRRSCNCNARRLSVCLSIFLLATLHKTTERIFTKIIITCSQGRIDYKLEITRLRIRIQKFLKRILPDYRLRHSPQFGLYLQIPEGVIGFHEKIITQMYILIQFLTLAAALLYV